MASESRIQRLIATELRRRACCVIKTHGSPYSSRGTPDLLVCVDGRFVALEVKRPGGKPTTLQQFRLGEVRAAGGVAEVVSSVNDALAACGFEPTEWR